MLLAGLNESVVVPPPVKEPPPKAPALRPPVRDAFTTKPEALCVAVAIVALKVALMLVPASAEFSY